MVQVLEEAVTGWQVAGDGVMSVALDLALDEGLRQEGQAREVVRLVNDLRRTSGLRLQDRIVLRIAAAGEVARAVRRHSDEIARETLAVHLETVETVETASGLTERVMGTGERVLLRIEPAVVGAP